MKGNRNEIYLLRKIHVLILILSPNWYFRKFSLTLLFCCKLTVLGLWLIKRRDDFEDISKIFKINKLLDILIWLGSNPIGLFDRLEITQPTILNRNEHIRIFTMT